MAGTLVLLRHGQSEWNLLNLFTGWKDPGLTERGYAEARTAGEQLKARGLRFDRAFVSDLGRAQETLKTAAAALGQTIETETSAALRERDYGDLSGLNKDDARKKWGEEQVRIWRRSYDVPPPGGESLRDTVARTLPFYCQAILPSVLRGEAVLAVAHGNSLRALVMVLDRLDAATIPGVEIATGVPIVYRLGSDGLATDKQVLGTPAPH